MEVLYFIWDMLQALLSYIVSIFQPQSTFQFKPGQTKPTVAVVGSGFSGMCAAIQVKKQFGIKAQIFEASKEIGGTWDANRYPGCACDIPSHLYSFSFELNPNWSHSYSPQQEILDYMRGVSVKYGLPSQTLLSTEVVGATWMDNLKKWKLEYKSKTSKDKSVKTAYFDIVFAGLGPLRIPKIPDQYKEFKGPIVHTAFWDSSINFKGKRVAVIGSGASAVQAVPELQKIATRVVSYQRSPVWIIERSQVAYSKFIKNLFNICPPLVVLHRWFIFIQQEMKFPMIFRGADSYFAKRVRKMLIRQMTTRLEKHGRGELANILIPDYPVGCKRICRSENYMDALAQPNIVVKKGNIKEVNGQTLVHEDGSKEKVDILVLATGFNVQGFLGNLQIHGRDNLHLNKEWDERYPSTLQAVNIPKLPNFFMLLGPNSALGHNSVVIMSEIQVEYAMKSIRYMIENNLAALEVKKEAAEAYSADIQAKLKNTPWAGSCTSFYKNDRGELYTLWCGTVTYFWYKMRHANYLQDFIQHVKS